MHLREACAEVMKDKEVTGQYPDGMNSSEILWHIRDKHGAEAFPYVSIIDVCDEMRSLYG